MPCLDMHRIKHAGAISNETIARVSKTSPKRNKSTGRKFFVPYIYRAGGTRTATCPNHHRRRPQPGEAAAANAAGGTFLDLIADSDPPLQFEPPHHPHLAGSANPPKTTRAAQASLPTVVSSSPRIAVCAAHCVGFLSQRHYIAVAESRLPHPYLPAPTFLFGKFFSVDQESVLLAGQRTERGLQGINGDPGGFRFLQGVAAGRACRHVGRTEHRRALLRSCLGIAGAGADDRQGAARVGRRVHHPRPRRLLRRRPRLTPPPVPLQGSGGGRPDRRRARGAAAGAGARVPSEVAEAGGGGYRVGATHAGARRRHAKALQALRRAAAVPAMRAARGKGLPGRGALRRMALRAPARRRARARAPQANGGRGPAEGAVDAGEGRAGGVPAARRGHDHARAHLPGRRRFHLRGRAVRDGWLHVPGPPAADATLRDVQEEGCAGRLRAVQAHAAALPPPRLRLRQAGPDHLPCALVQPFQGQGAGGQSGQDMAASGEEGDEGEGDVLLGR